MSLEIGLISDTHGFLDPQVARAFADVDEIWHAGDFGAIEIAQQLAKIKPLRGVYGNIDDLGIRDKFAEDLRFQCEGVRVWMTHIAGRPGRYPANIRAKLQSDPVDVLVCGHSHICHVERSPRVGGMLYLNPGAAGHAGFHVTRTLLKCRFTKGKVDNLRVVELGSRGRKPTNALD